MVKRPVQHKARSARWVNVSNRGAGHGPASLVAVPSGTAGRWQPVAPPHEARLIQRDQPGQFENICCALCNCAKDALLARTHSLERTRTRLRVDVLSQR